MKKKKRTSPLDMLRKEVVRDYRKFGFKYIKESDRTLDKFSRQLFSLSTFNLIFIATIFVFLENRLEAVFLFLPVKLWASIGIISGFLSILAGMLSLWLEVKLDRYLSSYYLKEARKVEKEKDKVTVGILLPPFKVGRFITYDLIYRIRMAQQILFMFAITSSVLSVLGGVFFVEGSVPKGGE